MSQPPDEQPVVRVSHLRKTFRIGFFRRRIPAVRDATFDVTRNEIFGLIGPNGAGKTTTLKMLMGLIVPDTGSASILGEDVRGVAARRQVGFLPETPHFHEYLRPGELLSYYGRLYGMSSRDLRRRIPELIELVGLAGAGEKQLRKFSKGMLQRLGLAQALLPDPSVVVLDEPQSGLDPSGRKEVRDIILSLRERGKTVLFSSHILPDVEQVCDRVAIIVSGRVTRVGRLDELIGSETSEIEVVLSPPEGEPTPGAEALAGAGRRTAAGHVAFTVESAAAATRVATEGAALGFSVESVTPHRRRLEEIFLEEIRSARGQETAP